MAENGPSDVMACPPTPTQPCRLAGGTMRVRAGRLGDAERQIVFESNRSGRRVLVATLHGCVEWSQHQAPGCEEPMQAVGYVTTWDHESFKLGGWSFLTNVPWESAVRVWWRDEAPPDEDVKAVLAEARPGVSAHGVSKEGEMSTDVMHPNASLGSGHDEQTEDWKRKALDYHRALSEGYGVEDGGVWEDRALAAEAELQQVRERTVAAVVEFLIDQPTTASSDAFTEAANRVAERFGSSVSGGE